MKANKMIVKHPVFPVPQNQEEAADFVRRIRDTYQEINSIKAGFNEQTQALNEQIEGLKKQIEVIRTEPQAKAKPLGEKISQLFEGLLVFSEGHREQLTDAGKHKSVKVASGLFGWRLTPPFVSIRNVKKIVAVLKERALERFLRIKEELDKEAMLKESEIAASIPGVWVGQKEEFFVKLADADFEIAKEVRKLKIAS